MVRVCRIMGWTWDYVEQTVTAARLQAIERMLTPSKSSGNAERLTIDQLRGVIPHGVKHGG